MTVWTRPCAREATLLARHPSLDIALPSPGHPKRILGYVLGNRRSRRQKGARFDLDRRDQVHVAADKGAIGHLAPALRVAVVVDHHRATTKIYIRTHIGVPDIGQVRRLAPRTESRIFYLDKISDLDAVHQMRLRTQMRVRTKDNIVVQAAVLDITIRLDGDAATDERGTRNAATRLDHRIRADLHRRVDIGRLGIEEGNSLGHPPFVDSLAHCPGRPGELGAIVDPQALVRIFDAKGFNVMSSFHRITDDIGEIEFSLIVSRLDLAEPRPEKLRRDQVDTRVAFLQGEFLGARILSFNDSFDSALGVPHDPAGDIPDRGQHREVRTGLGLEALHSKKCFAAKKGRIAIEDQHISLKILQTLLDHHDGMAGPFLLGLDDAVGTLAQNLSNCIGLPPNHHDQSLGLDFTGDPLDMAQHGEPTNLVKHFGSSGTHSRALACGQNHHRSLANRLGATHQTALPGESPSPPNPRIHIGISKPKPKSDRG